MIANRLRLFCQMFSIRDALRHELGWAHYEQAGNLFGIEQEGRA